MINNEVRKEFFKAYESLSKAKIVETNSIGLDPDATWESSEKDVVFNAGSGVATSSGGLFDITADKNPNKLVVKSDKGMLELGDHQQGDYVVEKLSEVIKGNITGMRGWNGHPFVVMPVSNYTPYVNGGIRVFTGAEAPAGGTLTKNEYYNIIEENYLSEAEGYIPFIVNVERMEGSNSVGIDRFLVRPTEAGWGFDQELKNGTEKYQVVWDLVEQRNQPDNPMEFYTDSTIAINSITERLVKA